MLDVQVEKIGAKDPSVSGSPAQTCGIYDKGRGSKGSSGRILCTSIANVIFNSFISLGHWIFSFETLTLSLEPLALNLSFIRHPLSSIQHHSFSFLPFFVIIIIRQNPLDKGLCLFKGRDAIIGDHIFRSRIVGR